MRSTVTDSESSNVVHRTAILTPTPPPLRGGGETHFSQFSAGFCSPSPLAERGLGGEGIAARRLRARQRDFFSSLLTRPHEWTRSSPKSLKRSSAVSASAAFMR